jgi:hypothetical protein
MSSLQKSLPLLVLAAAAAVLPAPARGTEFECTIKSALRLSDSGTFATHDLAPNFMNRKFHVDRSNGRVTRTTALKDRLANFDAGNQPLLLEGGDRTATLRAVTVYPGAEQYALVRIDAPVGGDHPFLYHTTSGLILTGLCAGG